MGDDSAENSEGYSLKEFRFLLDLNMKLQRGLSRPSEYVDVKLREIEKLCTLVLPKIRRDPLLLELSSPIYVVGDLHGQYYDLMRIFRKLGFPSEHKYLFLGDYVDRGPQSVETVALLFTYKAIYPENIYLLRGNHEDRQICRLYGLKREMQRRYGLKSAYHNFVTVFNQMSLAAILDNTIFCVHGGLSKKFFGRNKQDLRQIFSSIARPLQLRAKTLPFDILWSDPMDSRGGSPKGWRNSTRGEVVQQFGHDVTNVFLDKFSLTSIIRAHQWKMAGFQAQNHGKIWTVFSAPNYCNIVRNNGAVFSFQWCEDKSTMKITKHIFEPNNLVYSIPFYSKERSRGFLQDFSSIIRLFRLF